MKKYLLFAIVLMISACTSIFTQIRNKRFQRYPTSMVRNIRSDTAVLWDSIVLDTTFQLYIRQICRKRPSTGYYESHDPDLPADVKRCNCEESQDVNPEKLEIQYLFYSEAKKQFVYITTIPPHVEKILDPTDQAFKKFNTYDEPLFTIENFANINYFNTFFLGRSHNQQLLMTPVDEEEYPYQIDFTQSVDKKMLTFDKFHFSKNNVGNPNLDLGTKVRFYRKDHWLIGLNDLPSERSLDTVKNNNFLENRTIYLLSHSSDPKHQPTDILFYFQQPYLVKDGKTWHWLHFEDFRIKSY